MYLLIENFNSGLDSRRMALTSKPGTLQRLENAHITRGGEIEKRKAFVATASLPAGTFGLHSANGALWVFGSEDNLQPNVYGAVPPSPAPESFYIPRVNYMKLNSGGWSASLNVHPFGFSFSSVVQGESLIKGALVVDVPPGGMVPWISYKPYHFTFSGQNAPPNGNYTTDLIRGTTPDSYRLVIYFGVETTPNTTVNSPSLEFSSYTGPVSWTEISSNTSNQPHTHAPSSSFKRIRYLRQVNPVAGDIPNFSNAFYIKHSPVEVLSNLDSEVKLCSIVSLGPYPACAFIIGEDNDPGDSATIYVANNQIGLNSLSYTNQDNLSRTIINSPVSFFPPLETDWSKYSKAKNWLIYAAEQLAAKINSTSSISLLSAQASFSSVLVSSYSQFYTTDRVTPGAAMGWYTTQPTIARNFSVKSKGFKSGMQMTELLSVDNFRGKIYAIAKFSGGGILHFYNGKRVSSWDSIATSGGDSSSVAASFALEIKKENEYESTSLDNKVFIQFFKKNTTYPVSAYTANGGSSSQNLTITTTAADADSPQFTTIEISGSYEQYDIFTVIIAGESYSVQAGASVVGRFCRTHMDKMYSTSGSLLYFSETSTNGGPSAFTNDTANGAGVINLSSQDSGSSALTSIALYQGKLAIFSETSVQIWTMNADPKLNSFSQILNNVGTSSPNSVVSLGNIDTYFLSQLGVRSLRARDASNVAIVSDVGNPIDDLIISDMLLLSESTKSNAVGLIDPVDGRYWLSVGPKVYVYSYFPSSGINAWSVYFPTVGPDRIPLELSSLCSLNNRIYARSGDFIFAYGGLAGNYYDETVVTVQMPFLDGGKPAHFKTAQAIDSACVGAWDVSVAADISAPDLFDYVGKIENSTYSNGRIMTTAIGTHLSVKMVNSYLGYAKIGNFAIHFEVNDAG